MGSWVGAWLPAVAGGLESYQLALSTTLVRPLTTPHGAPRQTQSVGCGRSRTVWLYLGSRRVGARAAGGDRCRLTSAHRSARLASQFRWVMEISDGAYAFRPGGQPDDTTQPICQDLWRSRGRVVSRPWTPQVPHCGDCRWYSSQTRIVQEHLPPRSALFFVSAGLCGALAIPDFHRLGPRKVPHEHPEARTVHGGCPGCVRVQSFRMGARRC